MAIIKLFTWFCCLFSICAFGQVKEKYYEEYRVGVSEKPVLTVLITCNREGREIKTVQKYLKDNLYIAHTITNTYDDAGRKTKREEVRMEKGMKPVGFVFKYSYTANGYESVQGNAKIIHQLDEKGNESRSDSFFRGELKATTEFRYDEKQRLVQQHHRSVVDNYSTVKTIRYEDAQHKRFERVVVKEDSVTVLTDTESDMNGDTPIKIIDLLTNEVTIVTLNERGDPVESKTYNAKNELVAFSKSTCKYWRSGN